MSAAAVILALALQAQPASPEAPSPPPPAPPPSPAFEIEPPKRYGDRGTSHLSLMIGLGSGTGGFRYAVGGEYGYFVLPGVAPGVQAEVSGGSGVLTTGLLMGTLRLVPIRTSSVSVFLVGRGGRVLLSDHGDGWGAGGGGGIIFFSGGRIGFQIAYEVLQLMPADFCADLSSGCRLQGLQAGIVAGF